MLVRRAMVQAIARRELLDGMERGVSVEPGDYSEEDQMTRPPDEVFEDHLRLRSRGDLETDLERTTRMMSSCSANSEL